MCDPCGGGKSSSSSAQAGSTNQTTVNVSTPVNIDTTDLAQALEALAGAQVQQASINNAGRIEASIIAAEGQVASAQVAAHAGPSTTTIILVVVAVAGLAFTAGLIKLPRGLRA